MSARAVSALPTLVIAVLLAGMPRAPGAQENRSGGAPGAESPAGNSQVSAEPGDALLVLTSLPVTYSIASALADGTRIEVRNVPEQPRPMNALISLLEQRADRYAEDFTAADAVVTIGKLWRDDPLYTAARGRNIRVVQIDATKPWSTTLEGVSVATEPAQDAPWRAGAATGGRGGAAPGTPRPAGTATDGPAERVPSVYFWLSPANGARAAEIIAADLARLAPGDAERVEANLAGLRRDLLGLKREYEVKLAAVPDVTVYALAAEFVYLTLDLGLFVDGYFLEQDIDWTDEDRAALTAHLRDRGIGVVIHKWEPDASILAAIEAGGARLVTLDPIDVGMVEEGVLAPGSYLRLLGENLAALYAALDGANR